MLTVHTIVSGHQTTANGSYFRFDDDKNTKGPYSHNHKMSNGYAENAQSYILL